MPSSPLPFCSQGQRALGLSSASLGLGQFAGWRCSCTGLCDLCIWALQWRSFLELILVGHVLQSRCLLGESLVRTCVKYYYQKKGNWEEPSHHRHPSALLVRLCWALGRGLCCWRTPSLWREGCGALRRAGDGVVLLPLACPL